MYRLLLSRGKTFCPEKTDLCEIDISPCRSLRCMLNNVTVVVIVVPGFMVVLETLI